LDDAKDWLIVEEKKEEDDYRPEIKLKDPGLHKGKEDDDSV
jgi:hypothetical protein